MAKTCFVQGNEACALAAMYAGLDFFAGYPITPSTEIAETLAAKLPEAGKKFIQMEDEIASMCAIIGASLTGSKVMTATSGPGFSLMQESLGYAVMAEAGRQPATRPTSARATSIRPAGGRTATIRSSPLPPRTTRMSLE
jgi:pyruvate/2-oxoacid:ferredoxin oxidoreductase alpha subunit